MSKPRTALVIVQSRIAIDPRVVRQIEWLGEEGWVVDSLGFGEKPVAGMRDHFAIGPVASWTKPKPGLGILHSLPYRTRFRILAESRFPAEVGERIARGDYDLIIFNDTHLIPWLGNTSVFTPAALRAHIHLDLHEFFPVDLPASTRFRFLLNGYHRWGRRFISSPAFTTRSTVVSGIADLYQAELGGPPPTIVRNAPPYVEQEPTPVDPGRIRLLHHGVAAWERGLRELVDAVRLLDDRFEITFMLTGSAAVIAELKEYSADIRDRVHVVPPAPMAELATTVNAFDLEVMFYKPMSTNLRLALPNKLFEAIQGRLGLVIGESPMMAEVVRAHDNGVICTTGWTAEDLAAALSPVTAADVERFKANSHRVAREFSAENERIAFFASIATPTP